MRYLVADCSGNHTEAVQYCEDSQRGSIAGSKTLPKMYSEIANLLHLDTAREYWLYGDHADIGCRVLKLDGNKNFAKQYASCTERKYFICEKSAQSTDIRDLTAGPTSSAVFSDPWKTIGDVQYLMHLSVLSHQDCEIMCQVNGGSLADLTITSLSLLTYPASAISITFWTKGQSTGTSCLTVSVSAGVSDYRQAPCHSDFSCVCQKPVPHTTPVEIARTSAHAQSAHIQASSAARAEAAVYTLSTENTGQSISTSHTFQASLLHHSIRDSVPTQQTLSSAVQTGISTMILPTRASQYEITDIPSTVVDSTSPIDGSPQNLQTSSSSHLNIPFPIRSTLVSSQVLTLSSTIYQGGLRYATASVTSTSIATPPSTELANIHPTSSLAHASHAGSTTSEDTHSIQIRPTASSSYDLLHTSSVTRTSTGFQTRVMSSTTNSHNSSSLTSVLLQHPTSILPTNTMPPTLALSSASRYSQTIAAGPSASGQISTLSSVSRYNQPITAGPSASGHISTLSSASPTIAAGPSASGHISTLSSVSRNSQTIAAGPSASGQIPRSTTLSTTEFKYLVFNDRDFIIVFKNLTNIEADDFCATNFNSSLVRFVMNTKYFDLISAVEAISPRKMQSYWITDLGGQENMTGAPRCLVSRVKKSGIVTVTEADCQSPNNFICMTAVDHERVLNKEAFQQMISEMVVEKKSTRKNRRKLFSASDHRRSAQAVGCLGVFMVSLVVFIIVAMDLTRVKRGKILCQKTRQ